jgi:hypothetical protein
MRYAAITFVYNESINLPIWVKYYGNLFGHQNLYVLDRGSDDGSTQGLGDVNVIKLPRKPFDEDDKTNLMSSFHAGLTSAYDAVVITDCDEIIAPDPARYRDLADYIDKMDANYVNAVGIDILHIITEELPLDLTRPILSQRATGRFHAPECKQLLSRVPMKWLPGLHSSTMAPRFDTDLFILHLKLMDYGMAVGRQVINLGTLWSEASLKANYGSHHRWKLADFVKQAFFTPIDMLNRNVVGEFEFSLEAAKLTADTVIDPKGYYRVPMNMAKLVRFPERFAAVI